jgi:predicted nucleic acid-binding protein
VLLVDTGVLVAAADTDDTHHEPCKALLEGDPGQLVTTAMVIAETAYLLDRQLGPRAEAALFASITDGNLTVENVGGDDWARIGELVSTYADLRLGGTDASLVALAERLGVTTIASLNRRHFTVVRPRHIDVFELLP